MRVTVLFCMLAISCSQSQDLLVLQDAAPMPVIRAEELTEEQAIKLPEDFIVQNGYTDLPPDKENITKESIEWTSDLDELLKGRHNSLERRAYGVSQGRKTSSLGWTIVFRFKDSSSKETRKNGRAVTMNLGGSGAMVEQVEFILAKVDRKL